MATTATKKSSKRAVKGATTTVANTNETGNEKEEKTMKTKATESGDTEPKDTTPTEPTPTAPATPTVTTAGPLAERVTQAMAYIKMAIAVLMLQPPALTAAQRKRMGKLPKGGEKYIPTLAQIAQTVGVQIRTQPTAAMSTAIQTAATLQPLMTLLSGFVQEVQDTGFGAQSDSWGTASALYAVLKRMSHKDPSLKTQLAPVADFFKSRAPTKKKKAAEKAAKDASQAVTAPQADAESATPQPATTSNATSGATAPHAGTA